MTAPQTAAAAGTSLDYTFTVQAPAAPYFSAAEAIRTGALYAEKMRVDPHEQPADRDPKADDQLGVVGVAAWEGGPTFYYPVPDMIELNRDQFTDDAVILHEYAHFLQDQIGSLPWIPTSHNGCEVHDIFGQIVNSPEHAWLEGFADYFAEAVRADSEPGTVGGRRWAALLESPVCRYLSSSIASQDVELYVAGVLWDLIDPARPSEPHDTLAGFAPTIFQIFDRELDVDPGAGPWPSLSSFRAAWDARGLPALNEIMNFLQISGSLPARPLPPPTPDDKVCSKPAPPPDCEPPK
jgi:hypothetical protein